VIDPTIRTELDERHDYECWNCHAPCPENGLCPVCGTAPHDGDGWKAECLQCGEVLTHERGTGALHEMMMHRLDDCSEAEFEVTAF